MAHGLRLHPSGRRAGPVTAAGTHHLDTHWTLTLTAFAMGIVAVGLAMAGLSTGRYAVHLAALVLAIPGLLLAAWSHTVSDSTNQRWFTVVAMLACGLAAWVSAPGMHLI